jgi:hypothetical protein
MAQVTVSQFANVTPTPNSDLSLNHLHQLLGMMAVNDASFTPKLFTGATKDAEKTEQRLDYFLNYSEFWKIRGLSRLQLFKLLLTDQAAERLRSVSDTILNDFDQLLRDFRKRFSLIDLDRWRKASALWSREQKKDESVDAYEVQNSARIVPVTDQILLRFAVIRGLRPEIRLHVLQSQADTMDAVIKSARVAEAALAASSQESNVSILTQQVTQLLNKLDQQQTVAAVNQLQRPTSPSVTFADTQPEMNTDDRQQFPRVQSPGRYPVSREVESRRSPSVERSNQQQAGYRQPARQPMNSFSRQFQRSEYSTNPTLMNQPRWQTNNFGYRQQSMETGPASTNNRYNPPRRFNCTSTTGNCISCGR